MNINQAQKLTVYMVLDENGTSRILEMSLYDLVEPFLKYATETTDGTGFNLDKRRVEAGHFSGLFELWSWPTEGVDAKKLYDELTSEQADLIMFNDALADMESDETMPRWFLTEQSAELYACMH